MNLNSACSLPIFNQDSNENTEPKLLEMLSELIIKSAECRNISELLEQANAIVKLLNPYCWEKIEPKVFEAFTSIKAQSKIFGLKIIEQFAQTYPQVISQYIPEIISKLISLSSEPKKDIKVQVQKTFEQVATTCTNVDVIHLFPVIISAYMSPVDSIEKALDALVATPFVNDVDIPTLGLIVPLLTKSMNMTRKMVYQRRAAVVMETMCKLLKNPIYAKQFYPVLKPALIKGRDEIAEPEIRKVCANSLEVLEKVYSQGTNKLLEAYTLVQCTQQYKSVLFSYSIPEDIVSSNLITHSIDLVFTLIKHENTDHNVWIKCIKPYLEKELGDEFKDIVDILTEKIKDIIIQAVHVDEFNPEDSEETLCDCQFSLAYGTRVLLHQTPFKVKVGRKYGLVGPNGAGKSTLMKAIANKNLQEFPEDLTSIYVEHDIQGDKSDICVYDYLATDEKVINKNISSDEIKKYLLEVNLDEHMWNRPITTLSGGQKMKLSLIRAVILSYDLVLLDEPTNHLDQFAVKWLVEYLNSLTKTTCLIVSHDVKFLDAVCTNIIHYEGLKLKFYRGNLAEFVKQKPEAIQYYQLESDVLSFNFPEPGPLEGVKSLTKAVLKMKDCSFQYSSAPKPQLQNVSIQVSMSSRVAICGVNGAGKSTLVKLLVGELEPNEGLIERHPNVRVAYISQYSHEHLSSHTDKTPVEYIMWRFRGGIDKEAIDKDGIKLTAEEIAELKANAQKNKSFIVKELGARRTGKREHEYEAKADGPAELVQWFTKSELVEMGYEKLVKECDERIAMESMMGQKKLTTGEIQKHFDCVGLEPEIAQHTKIGALSGGQKARCTFAACTWSNPHLIILDEPTNFLDRDSQAALAGAIKSFKGGILIISHNAEFYEAITQEKWILEGGYLTALNTDWADAIEKERKRQEKLDSKKLKIDGEDEKFDSLGNKIEAPTPQIKELNRADKKKLLKLKKDMEKRGEDTYEIDQMLGLE
jgi:elongation factor 3